MLNVSQPSISKVLAHAEQQLGYLLFDRGKGKLTPTPEAHRLFSHVSAVYDDIDRLRHVAENLKAGNSGHIRIASTPAFGLEVLPRAVASFRSQNRDAIFEIDTLHLDEMHDALIESRIDIGLAFDPIAVPAIDAKEIASSRFVVLAPKNTDFNGKSTLSIEDLRDHAFIGLNSRGPLGRSLSTYLSTGASDLNIVTWCETYHVAKALVGWGAGVTIADEVTALSGSQDNIQILSLQPELRFDIKVLHLAAAPLSIIANKFIQHLTKTLNDFLGP